MKMFNLIGYGERAGSGVPDIFAVWQDAGYREPTVEEQFGNGQPNRMIMTLPLVGKDQDVFGKRPEKRPEKRPDHYPEQPKKKEIINRVESVLELIMAEPTISRAAIGERMHLTDRQVRTALEYLQKQEKICREGSDRRGKWIVK